MRTTLELDDRLHAAARQKAFDEHRSLGEVVSELALRGLEQLQTQRPKRRLGQFAGLVHLADDFNDTPPDVLASIEQPLA